MTNDERKKLVAETRRAVRRAVDGFGLHMAWELVEAIASAVLAVAEPAIRAGAFRESAADCAEQADSLLYVRDEILEKQTMGGRPIKDELARGRYAHDFSQSAAGAQGLVSWFENKASAAIRSQPEPRT